MNEILSNLFTLYALITILLGIIFYWFLASFDCSKISTNSFDNFITPIFYVANQIDVQQFSLYYSIVCFSFYSNYFETDLLKYESISSSHSAFSTSSSASYSESTFTLQRFPNSKTIFSSDSSSKLFNRKVNKKLQTDELKFKVLSE